MAPPRIRPGLIPAVVPRYRRPALNPRIIDLMMRQSQELSEADRRQMAANVAPGQLVSAYFGGLGQQVREGFAHHQAQEDRRLALEDRQRLIAIQEEEAADRAHRRLLDDQAAVYQRSKDQEAALQGAPQSIIESTLGPRYQVDPQEFEAALREGRSPAGSVEAQDPTPRWTALQEGVAGAPLPDYAGLPLKAQASPSIPLETALPAQDTADPRTFMRASRGVDRETGKPLDPIAVPIVSDEQALERQKLIDAYTRRIEKADATDAVRLEYMLDAEAAQLDRDFEEKERKFERDKDVTVAGIYAGARSSGTGGTPTDALATDIGVQVGRNIRFGSPVQSWSSIKTTLGTTPKAIAILRNAIIDRVGAETDDEIQDLIDIDTRASGMTEAVFLEGYPQRRAEINAIRRNSEEKLNDYFSEPSTPGINEWVEAFSQLDEAAPNIKDLRVDLVETLLNQQTSAESVRSLVESLRAYNAAFPQSATLPNAEFFEKLAARLVR